MSNEEALMSIAYALNGIDEADLTHAERQIVQVLVLLGLMHVEDCGEWSEVWVTKE